MTASTQTAYEQAARRYALGALSDAESLDVEQRFVTDPEAYDVLLAVTDDLAEDYLDGALTREDRERFETHFLAIPEHQERLRVVRALRENAAPAAVAGSARARGLATAAIVALAVSGGVAGWLLMDPPEPAAPAAASQPPRPVEPTAAAPPSAAPDAPAASAPDGPEMLASAAPAPSGPPEFQLTGGLTRGGGTLPRVAIPDGATSIRLRLQTPSPLDAGTYQATIEDVDGASVYTALVQRGAASPASLSLTVPSDRLPRGDYRLVLAMPRAAAPETVATFPFRVTTDASGQR